MIRLNLLPQVIIFLLAISSATYASNIELINKITQHSEMIYCNDEFLNCLGIDRASCIDHNNAAVVKCISKKYLSAVNGEFDSEEKSMIVIKEESSKHASCITNKYMTQFYITDGLFKKCSKKSSSVIDDFISEKRRELKRLQQRIEQEP